MLAINCGLNLPESLTRFISSFQCEFGIKENNLNNNLNNYLFNEKEALIDPAAYWEKLWKDGKLVLEITLKFDVEFPAENEDENQLLNHEENGLLNDEENRVDLSSPVKNLLPVIEPEPKKELGIASDNTSELVKLIEQIFSLKKSNSVQLCSEGIGGTYFINDSEKRIAVFKPIDEEPGAVNNPKGQVCEPLLPPGGGALREVAAYLLDHQHFAGVPETHLLSTPLQHPCFKTPKMGSIQKYVENIENHDMSSSRFSVEDVHKIGILDVRLMNMDRNEENFLIQLQKDDPKNPKLIPIDHSYILPSDLSFVWFEWLHWKQAKQPFQKSHLEYIEALDIKKDTEILRNLGFEKEAIRTLMISTTFLKIAALKFGYNLFQIGQIISRKKLTEESDLEKLVKKTENLVLEENAEITEEKFTEVLSKVITEELQNKVQK